MSEKRTCRSRRRVLRNILLLTEILIISLIIVGGSRLSIQQEKAARKNNRIQKTVQTTIPDFSWNNYKVIAHALGGLDGKSYLNSRESFISSYKKGVRLFEVDLTKTSDGVWVCRHNWNKSLGQWQGEEKMILTAEEFLERPIYGKYTPMSLEDLLVLLKDYPDAFVLLDSKQYSIRNYRRTLDDYSEYVKIAQNAGAEKVLEQLIPEIYNQAMFSGTALIYDFPSYIYSLWQEYPLEKIKEIAAFCKEKKIPAVTVYSKYWTEEIQEIFEKHGLLVYVYTVNEESEAKKFMRNGVAGICSDILLDKDLGTKKENKE